MTRITSSDQALALLRARLQEAGRTGKGPKASKSAAPRRQRPLERLRELENEQPEQEQHRALIRAMLTEQLGAAVANDSSFQDVVERVTSLIESEPDGHRLLREAYRQLMAR